MKKIFDRAIALLLAVLLFPVVVVSASDDESQQVFSQLSATSYCLMDALTHEAISESNSDMTLPMASTTKIMTCVIALENGSPSDIVEIPNSAVGTEGSSVYLVQGEKLTLEELLYALMLESANDAAVAIALHISDEVDAFVDLMNQKAIELGMFGTNFVNPHGLPAEGHFSTARDLCTLLAYAMQNPAFRVYSGTKSTTISAPNSSKRFLSNHNKLLRIYDSCIGGKTGFTKEAGRCLVTASEKNGRLLICATLGDPNDWSDHTSLFDYGFSLFEEKLIVNAEEVSITVPVVGGKAINVSCSNKEPITFWLKSDEIYRLDVELPAFVYADIYEDQLLGYAVFSVNDIEVQRLGLYAQNAVLKREDALSFWEKIVQRIRLWME